MTRIAVEAAEKTVLRTIGDGLSAHNVRYGGAKPSPEEFVVTLRDEGTRLMGGVTCDLYLGGLLVEWVWVEEQARGGGHGRALMAAAEGEGIGRGAAFAHLDTFTFQARGFYERCGYTVFGVLDYPGGVRRFYMRKTLAEAA